MDRAELDAFFAKAEDVLTDWHPSDDAMVARVADEGADLPLADSYYSQRPLGRSPLTDIAALYRNARRPPDRYSVVHILAEREPELMRRMIAAMEEAARQIARSFEQIRMAGVSSSDALRGLQASIAALPSAAPQQTADDGVPQDPRERALYLRRHRNNGPARRTGLDGHHRRRMMES